jgi:hypothetical protein
MVALFHRPRPGSDGLPAGRAVFTRALDDRTDERPMD